LKAGSRISCIECGAAVDDASPFAERCFCSEACAEAWDCWRLRERGAELPGLGESFADGGWPSFEQAIRYAIDILGCMVHVFCVSEAELTLEVWFEWSVPDHELFAMCGSEEHQPLANAFSCINGFAVPEQESVGFGDVEENIGFRRGKISRGGKDLATISVDVILEVVSAKQQFSRQCGKWAKVHIDDLRQAALGYFTSVADNPDLVPNPVIVEEMNGSREFMDWLKYIEKPEAGSNSRLKRMLDDLTDTDPDHR